MKNTTNTLNGSTEKWKGKLINYTEDHVKVAQNMHLFYKSKHFNIQNAGIHLAIFTEPFLSSLLNGQKTIESRFSLNKIPPFQKVSAGDIVYVKKSGGEVVAFFFVGTVNYYNNLGSQQLKDLKKKFSKGICSHLVENFWENKHSAKYISLFEVFDITKISPIKVEKRDRTAWSTIKIALTHK